MTDTATSSTVAEITALEDQRYQAMFAKDLAALRELFADDLVYTHSNALIDTKASYLEAIDKEVFRYRGATRHDERVRVYGDTALVTGRAELEVVAGGSERQLNIRFLAVWARRDGRWRFVGWQSTPVPR